MQSDALLRISGAIEGVPVTVFAADGYPLAATWFVPERGKARGTVIVHGATATPAAFYRRFARFLASRGLRALTYDYRGIGGSRRASLDGVRTAMSDWALLDARAMHAHARTCFPGEPVAVVGHSFGGQLLGLLDEAGDARGAVLVAAQFGYYGHWPLPARAWIAFAWKVVVPVLAALLDYVPGALLRIGEDLPSGVARQWARWCSHPDYYLGDHPDARARLAAFDRPTLFYSFTDDHFAPEPAVASLLEHLPAARLDHQRIDPADHGGDPIGHFGFFRAHLAAHFWPAAADFLSDTLAGITPAPQERSGRFRISDDVMADLQFGRP